jgi:hypothetical protein
MMGITHAVRIDVISTKCGNRREYGRRMSCEHQKNML